MSEKQGAEMKEREFTRGVIVLQHSGCSTHFVLQRTNEEEHIGGSFTNIMSEGGGLTLNKGIASVLQNAGVNIYTEEMIKLGSIRQLNNNSWLTTQLMVALLDCGRRQISSVEELTRRKIEGLVIYNLGYMHEEIYYNQDPYFLSIAARLIARKLIYC